MSLPYEIWLGWRHTRAGRTSHSNGFISFIALVSVLGIALGVAALIIVLSVMNGFQKEVRERMLAVVAHLEVLPAPMTAPDVLAQASGILRQQAQVQGMAPFVQGQALLAFGSAMQGVLVRGIDPSQEAAVQSPSSALPAALVTANAYSMAQLHAGRFGMVLGEQLAKSFGLQVGDTATLVLPAALATPAGVLPRLRQMTVVGLFESGHYEYDSGLVMLHIADAQALYRDSAPLGLRIRLANMMDAPAFKMALQQQLPQGLWLKDWTDQNRAWFAAVKVEKTMMFIILTMIVAVAAFNLVSTLVMSVTDKRAEIAILRTLGASPGSIMTIFMVQGAIAGAVGTLLGLGVGLLVALHVGGIVAVIEGVLGTRFLPPDIYFISAMPSDPQASDIVPVVVISLALAFLATLYPSWRAARVRPAQALRYE